MKTQKHEFYKSYINKTVVLIKTSKRNHYKKYFETNKKNCKALWNGVHEIIYSKKKGIAPSPLFINEKTITNKKHIVENFNNFFTTIRKKIQDKIHRNKKDYSHYLQHPNPNTFFMTPTSPKKIPDIIQNLNTDKSTGSNSLPTKLLKQTKEIISLPCS